MTMVEWVPVVAAIGAATTAGLMAGLLAPAMTHRHLARHEHVKFSRDRRADLYVTLLDDGYWRMLDLWEMAGANRGHPVSSIFPSGERDPVVLAQLEGRLKAFASQEVEDLAEAFYRAVFNFGSSEETVGFSGARLAEDALRALQQQIRAELNEAPPGWWKRRSRSLGRKAARSG